MTADLHLALHQLIEPSISLEQAWCVLNLAAQLDRAAASTLEALMFSLRQRRTAALSEPTTQYRLGELSEQQLHEVGARLQHLEPEIAKPWSADEIEQLTRTWITCHA
jgi:hypothetical protein